jgi:hypothetical protein
LRWRAMTALVLEQIGTARKAGQYRKWVARRT